MVIWATNEDDHRDSRPPVPESQVDRSGAGPEPEGARERGAGREARRPGRPSPRRTGMDAGFRQAAPASQGDPAHSGEDRPGARGDRARRSAVILDTNALSAFVDGDPLVGEILRGQPRAAIPVIVLGEFRYGIAQSRQHAAYDAWLRSHLPQFDILPVTEDTAAVYASVRVALKRSCRPIPA